MNSCFSTGKAIFKSSHKTYKGALSHQGRAARLVRQLSVAVLMPALILTMAACSSNEPVLPKGAVGFIEGFLGGVVADEPRAALIGRNILSSGGSAADAVTAMYFTLAVTMPSRAGLGGGGVCLAFDQASGKTEALDFMARSPSVIGAGADRPSAVPGNPRGFFALQARYGNLLWRQVVTPAEGLARFGHPTSRAFARDLQDIGPAILADPGALAMFAPKSGATVAEEGEKIEQLDLAATLGMLRGRGVGPFYTGPFASHFVKTVQGAGGTLTVEELRAFRPVWRDTVRVKVGDEIAHFAPPPAAASTQAAIELAMLNEDGSFEDVDEGGRAHLLAEVAVHAFADRETWLNAQGQETQAPNALVAAGRIETLSGKLRTDQKTNPAQLKPLPKNRHESRATTSFMAADGAGNAVACAVTMNASFGTGRVAQGTGILLAAAPDTAGRGPTGLAPMLLVNENSKEFRMAAGADGGVAAPTILAGVVARMTRMNQSAKDAVAAPRVHNGGDPDVTYVEPTLDAAALSRLSAAGHHTAAIQSLGQVNVLYCPDGLPTTPATCQMVADPRGAGLAVGSML